MTLPSQLRTDLGHLTAAAVAAIDRQMRDILAKLGTSDVDD
ncbi:hypothetical protein [Celeribacter baekdonensis]|nr:hypothetical protein [Celeribacter baekdonensis]